MCRQLGFDQALDYTPGGYFGQSTGPIHMTNVMCTGDEAAITDCTFSTIHSCDHSQDVGIYCQGSCVYCVIIITVFIICLLYIVPLHLQVQLKLQYF